MYAYYERRSARVVFRDGHENGRVLCIVRLPSVILQEISTQSSSDKIFIMLIYVCHSYGFTFSNIARKSVNFFLCRLNTIPRQRLSRYKLYFNISQYNVGIYSTDSKRIRFVAY